MLARTCFQQWQGASLFCHQGNHHHPRRTRKEASSSSSSLTLAIRRRRTSPILQRTKGGLNGDDSFGRARLVALHHQQPWWSGPHAEYTDSKDSARVEFQDQGSKLGLVCRDDRISGYHSIGDVTCYPLVESESTLASSAVVVTNGHDASGKANVETHGKLHKTSASGKHSSEVDDSIDSIASGTGCKDEAPIKTHFREDSATFEATELINVTGDGNLSTKMMQESLLEPRPPVDHVNGHHAVELQKCLQTMPVGLDDDLEYYEPKSGHRVIGVVVSGNHAKLDVDIGAVKLGHLHVKELLPIDNFQLEEYQWELPVEDAKGGKNPVPPSGHPRVVYDDEIFAFESAGPLVTGPLLIDVGTVLDLEVMGETVGGNALLSARRSGRRVAWERVRQIKEENEPIEIKITEWNEAGLISRIEGLRAFLPLVEFAKFPNKEIGENFEDFVGRKLWVTVTVAEEIRGNLVLSERQAWARKYLSPGTLHEGTVVQLFDFGARVQVNGTDVSGLIHISNIARGLIHQVSDVFEIGEQIKMMAVESPVPNRVAFSTADLESEKGLMLRDKQVLAVSKEGCQQAIKKSLYLYPDLLIICPGNFWVDLQRVFREAEKMAEAFREANQNWSRVEKADTKQWADYKRPQKPIANRDWLDYGENTASPE